GAFALWRTLLTAHLGRSQLVLFQYSFIVIEKAGLYKGPASVQTPPLEHRSKCSTPGAVQGGKEHWECFGWPPSPPSTTGTSKCPVLAKDVQPADRSCAGVEAIFESEHPMARPNSDTGFNASVVRSPSIYRFPALLPNATRKIAFLPFAWGEKKLTTSSS